MIMKSSRIHSGFKILLAMCLFVQMQLPVGAVVCIAGGGVAIENPHGEKHCHEQVKSCDHEQVKSPCGHSHGEQREKAPQGFDELQLGEIQEDCDSCGGCIDYSIEFELQMHRDYGHSYEGLLIQAALMQVVSYFDVVDTGDEISSEMTGEPDEVWDAHVILRTVVLQV